MLSSGYAILYQKGKRYVHRAIFYLNKGQVFQYLKDGFLTDLLITRLLMLILYFYLHFFPFYINFLKTPSKLPYFVIYLGTRSMDRGTSHPSVDILVLVPFSIHGARTRMSIDECLEP